MIDVHAVNKKKKKKKKVNKKTKESKQKKQRFSQPITSTPHLISSDSYSLHGIYSPIHITPKSLSKILFCLFIFHYFFDQSSLACVSYNTK